VQYAKAAANRAAVAQTDVISAEEILEATATLKMANAKPLADNNFAVIIHPYAEYDIMKDTIFAAMFANAYNRGDEKNPYFTGFMGKALGCKFYVSSNAKVYATETPDVYGALVIGKGAFGIGGLAAYMPDLISAEQDGNNTYENVNPLRLIDKTFGSAGADDPLEQRASMAWYTTFVAKRLQEAFMVRIEHGTTLGS